MATKAELEQALKDSDAQVNQLENDVDYFKKENYDLEGEIFELKKRSQRFRGGNREAEKRTRYQGLKNNALRPIRFKPFDKLGNTYL